MTGFIWFSYSGTEWCVHKAAIEKNIIKSQARTQMTNEFAFINKLYNLFPIARVNAMILKTQEDRFSVPLKNLKVQRSVSIIYRRLLNSL